MKDREILDALMVKLEAYLIAVVRQMLNEPDRGESDRRAAIDTARKELLDCVDVAEQLKEWRK